MKYKNLVEADIKPVTSIFNGWYSVTSIFNGLVTLNILGKEMIIIRNKVKSFKNVNSLTPVLRLEQGKSNNKV